MVNHLIPKSGGALMLAMFSAASHAQTVNMNSDAYKTGHLIGQVFVGIIVLVVIKKLFFSSKE